MMVNQLGYTTLNKAEGLTSGALRRSLTMDSDVRSLPVGLELLASGLGPIGLLACKAGTCSQRRRLLPNSLLQRRYPGQKGLGTKVTAGAPYFAPSPKRGMESTGTVGETGARRLAGAQR